MEDKDIKLQEAELPAIEIKDLVKGYKLYDKPLASGKKRFISCTMP